jgi:hypothetical protein
MLPKQTYHVFTDNLFSLLNLFRALHKAGCRAIGTARPNCSITPTLKSAKESHKAGNGSLLQYNNMLAIPTKDNKVRSLDGLYIYFPY